MDSFYERWMALQPDAAPSEQAIHNLDRFDHKDWAHIHAELDDLAAATDALAEVVETGRPLMADAFWSFFKTAPKLNDKSVMDPLNVLNLSVMEQVVDLNQWHELRRYTKGDDVASGMACVEIEPDLESLADRTRQQRADAQDMAAKLAALRDAQAEKRSVDEMYEAMLEQATPDDEDAAEEAASELDAAAQAVADAAQAVEDAEAAARAAGEGLQEALEGAIVDIRSTMAGALSRAAQELRDMSESSQVWGIEPGEWQKKDANERIALAKRLNNPRLEKIAEKLGPMKEIAFTEQQRRVEFARTEVVDITLGDDLSSILASEMVRLDDPDQEDLFYRDLVEGNLLQYRLEGRERVGKGGIIMLEDGSGSMEGEKELWAKAVMLCLLHIARKQGRSFTLIHFGSPGEYKVLHFEKYEDFTTERIIEAAELFFDGGTDFETPFNVAIEQLQAQHRAKGMIEGDVIMVTDGECQVSQQWMSWYKEEQARLKFATYGVLIGHTRFTTLGELTEGKVCTVQDLATGGDVRAVFRGV